MIDVIFIFYFTFKLCLGYALGMRVRQKEWNQLANRIFRFIIPELSVPEQMCQESSIPAKKIIEVTLLHTGPTPVLLKTEKYQKENYLKTYPT